MRFRLPARVALAGLASALLIVSLALGPLPGAGASNPSFEWRGVIQAGYGPRFSHSDRVRLLRFMAGNGFNAYVHAPKEDPYQRTLWRDPYPEAQQAQLNGEAALAASMGIEWVANVSPGLPLYPDAEPPPAGTVPSAPICFSCPADLQALLAKLEPFRQAGVRTFMVSFDDVRREFTDPADGAYGVGDVAYGRANADLLNRLHSALLSADPSARLLTVPADYHGTGDTDYLRGFRGTLAPGVEVMWTGNDIQSRSFSPSDAEAFASLVGRVPIIWENWTTTDILRSSPDSPPSHLFLGPYARRPDVAGHLRGFFFNAGNESELNKVPLATAGDWMADPSAYRARRSFRAAVRRLARRRAAWLRAFAETSYSTTLLPSVEAPTFARAAHSFLLARRGPGDGAEKARKLRRELRLVVAARSHLLRVKGLQPFVRQAKPFLRSARLAARAGLLATNLLLAEHLGARQQIRDRLRQVKRRSARHPQETYGSRRRVFGLPDNVMDGYLKRARRLDRAR